MQDSRITYVNGNWQGRIAPAQSNVREALSSCQLEWEYLDAAGDDGWGLVGAVAGVGGDGNSRVAYLQRDRK